MAFDEACFSEKEMHDIELFKNNLGLGITVAGYVCDEEEISGIFVKDVCAGSAAHLEGKIQKNDRIVKVNNKSLTDLTNQEAIEFLKNSGDVVLLTIERYLEDSSFKKLSRSIRSQTLPTIASHSFERPSRRGVFNCKSEVNLDVLPECDPVSSANLKLDKSSLPISPLCKNCDLSLKSSSNQNSSSNIKEIKEEKNSVYLNLKQNLSTACNILLPNSYNIGMVDANNEISQIIAKSDISANSDSIYFSKTSDDSEKDGYETCMDESLSDEGLVKNKVMENSCDVIQSEVLCAVNVSSGNVDLPGECSVNKNDNYVTTSDECLEYDRNFNNNLEIYSDPSEMTDADEFFLVEYVNDNVPENDINFLRESEVPYSYEVQTSVTYKCIKLHEYYNDFEDCLEEYQTYLENSSKKASNTLSNCDESYSCNQSLNTITTDDDILVQSNILLKCNSDPQLYYFEKLDVSDINSSKRRASYLSNYKDDLECNQSDMTVTSKQQGFNIQSQQNSSTSLKRYWTSLKNIQVHRNSSEKLGISIVCGKVDFHTSYNESWESTSGIFVKSILPNSAAGNTGHFQIGDRILEVNGIALTDIGHEEAASVIRSATNPITFVVQSLVPPFQNEIDKDSENFKIEPYNDMIEQNNKLNQEAETVENETEEKVDTPKEIALEEPNKSEIPDDVCVSEDTVPASDIPAKQEETNLEDVIVKPETTSVVAPVSVQEPKKDDDDEDDDEEEDDDFEDERELEGRIITKKGIQIDRSSAGNVKRTTEEIAADAEEEDEFGYTTDKIKKKYAKLGSSIMMVKLERGQQGLGLSLAGHKDRNCMAVFVCGLNPNGAAYRTGGIQVGDEILEVNGVVLHGRCHLNASAIIKGLAGPVFKILVLRRKAAIEDIAVKPLTQFPVALEEEVLEDKLSNYPNVRNITIKKEGHSLGIMIIEGKHAELGQGIFISDIQDGSPADKAGLEVGEMILAVNKEALLGANYDNAATLLKRTEGVVTLILSNPTKKSENVEADDNKASVLRTSGPPSRVVTPVPEPPADPGTCSIIPGRNTSIDIMTNNQGLGLYFVGGKDTMTADGIIIVEVFAGGAADKDKRLQAGDQIIEANGVPFKDVTHDCALQTLRQTLPKIKLVIFRPEKIEYKIIDVDLIRKPGKGLGLSLTATKCGKIVYISEILNGSNADVDGRITKGDILISVNEEKTENLNIEQIGIMLKTISGKAILKFHRHKSIFR